MHWLVKLFMLFWYGGCVYWIALAIPKALDERGTMMFVPALGVVMILAGASMVLFFGSLANDDRPFLEEVIGKALAGSATGGAHAV